MRISVLLALVLLSGGIMTPGGGVSTGDISKDDFGYQIPTQSPHTLERACTIRVGYCRVANLTSPATASRRPASASTDT